MKSANRFTKLLLKFIFLLLIMESSKADNTRMVIGGNPVGQNTWPSVVAIKTNSNGGFLCGGTLITPEWVLTAAHCIKGEVQGLYYEYSTNDIVVFSGTTKLDSKNGQNTRVRRIVVHPNYNTKNGANDLALLRLEKKLANETIPLYTNAYSPSTAAIVVGWDASNPKFNNFYAKNTYSLMMLQVTLPIVSNEICNLPKSYNGRVLDSMLCAGDHDGKRDSCDSGNPLFIRENNSYYQLGVSSMGDGCAKPGKYGIYTRISNYINWIQQIEKLPIDALPVEISAKPITPVFYPLMRIDILLIDSMFWIALILVGFGGWRSLKT